MEAQVIPTEVRLEPAEQVSVGARIVRQPESSALAALSVATVVDFTE